MEDKPSGVPPVKPKSISRESLDRYTRANTGGDPYARSKSQYGKETPATTGPETEEL